MLSAAVALLGSMLLFIGSSLRSMTATAVRSVPLDWQGPVASYREAQGVASGVSQQRGVSHALPAATAPFASVSHSGAAGVSTAGRGSLLAVPPGYEHSFNVYRSLQGGLAPGQIVLDRHSSPPRSRPGSGTRSRSPRGRAYGRSGSGSPGWR